MRALLLLCLLAGCLEEDDDFYEPICAEADNVHFRRAGHEVTWVPVAVGGSIGLGLECWTNGRAVLFDLETPAVSDDESVATTEMRGGRVFVRGVHDGTTTVRVSTYGSIEVTVQSPDHVAFRSSHDQIPPTVDVAFAKEFGTSVAVILVGATGDELGDDALEVVAPPDAILFRGHEAPTVIGYENVALGEHTLEVKAAGMTYATPFHIVDHADSISLVDPAVTIASLGSDVCFAARLDGRFVAHLQWSYDTEERSNTGLGMNCVRIAQWMDVNHDRAVSIHASASGLVTDVLVPLRP